MTRTEYIIDDDFLDDETKMSAESQGYLWELIRCKDCKYYRDGDCWHERENDRWIYYQSVINEPTPDDYCSLAERAKE